MDDLMTHDHAHDHDCGPCCCCGQHNPEKLSFLSRREFVRGTTLATAGVAALTGLSWPALVSAAAPGGDLPMPKPRKKLLVKPILTYSVYQRREKSSWRSWGGIQTEAQAKEEIARITGELKTLAKGADFPVEFLPVSGVRGPKDVAAIGDLDKADCAIIYGAGAWINTFDEIAKRKRDVIFFVRHRSGPLYLWYEVVSPRYLRKHSDDQQVPNVLSEDVVVDDQNDLAWRLRALCGLKNTMGTRMICIGGPSGWSQGGREAPKLTQDRFNFDLKTVTYDELGKLLAEAKADDNVVKLARQRTKQYLADPSVTMETDRAKVEQCFILDQVLRGIMAGHDAQALTINNCMGTIMRVSDTTACLTLCTLNDDGYYAYCESDFVVIPAGVLMSNISGRPSFLNDPTYPHHGVITLAHCTGPRRMDGRKLEPARLVTHFESDFGAAPKVEYTKGQTVTNVLTDFQFKLWLGVTGKISEVPFLPICRAQMDVTLNCDCDELAERMRGFHWMTIYGDYTKEIAYALRRTDIEFECLDRT